MSSSGSLHAAYEADSRTKSSDRELSIGALEEEQAAIRRCQDGDSSAYQLIVGRYANVLFGTALLMLRNRDQAEDAVQEAFVSAWRGLGTFKSDRSIRPWLVRILINAVLQKKRRKLLNLIALPLDAEPAEPSIGPEALTEKAWERDEVRLALAELPDDFSRVVILRFYAELPISEIAVALNIREGTVKSRLHRALQKLQKSLERRQIGYRDSSA